jgi:acetyltransferase-like isoleucine patch superfamily enzyme
MIRFLSRMTRSFLKRCRRIAFWFNCYGGRVRSEGRLSLEAPLLCDGRGVVLLGPNISVGCGLAPLLAAGTVRLQARERGSRIVVGAGTSFSNNVQVIAENHVTIGRNCLIGDAVLILDSDFHALSAEGRHSLPAIAGPVVLEDNVFIGSRSIILKGVTIGKDSVIGAGSVVVRSIPPGVIAAGNPARIVRTL